MDILQHTRQTRDSQRLFIADAGRPHALLKACPAYAPTVLKTVDALADACGVGSVHVKNESTRMGLGSFKALGGAFAVAQVLRDRAELMLGMWLPVDATRSDAVRDIASEMTFITASAGNHGLAVAAGARVFGANAVIVLSSTVPESFAERIRAMDAEVVRVDGDYEDSVRHARQLADEREWLLLADGSWEGYIDMPALVMEGYTVMAQECLEYFTHTREWPTHVYLQAGVGGMAAAVAAHIREHWPEQPVITVVEPVAAPCLYRSIEANGLVRADGPVSNMGRLDCKDASLIALDSLSRDADFFLTITDVEADEAVANLAAVDVATTPSGGAGYAGLIRHAAQTGLPVDARCLVFVSECA